MFPRRRLPDPHRYTILARLVDGLAILEEIHDSQKDEKLVRRRME